MPLQNRVTPLGDLPFGNRGLLHDAERRIVHHHQGRRWIICLLEFRGRRRAIMRPGRYTELFFLEEATALAAGHRPCAGCRRTDYDSFRRHWAIAHNKTADQLPPADHLDLLLHDERPAAPGPRKTYRDEIATLPAGVFVVYEGEPWLLWHSTLLRWTPGGYDRRRARPPHGPVTVLTPRATTRTVATGYTPTIHPTAQPDPTTAQHGSR